jgi:sensor histidine kinase YesM
MKPIRTIKRKLLLFYTLIMIITAFTSMYGLYTSLRMGQRVELLSRTELLMRNLRAQLSESRRSLDEFLMVQRDERREAVYAKLEELESLVSGRNVAYRNQEQLMVKDIAFLIEKYAIQMRGVAEAKAVRDNVGSTEAYKVAERTAAYIDLFIDKVLIENLNSRSEAYRFFSESYQQLQVFNFFLVLTAILLTVLLIFLFTDNLTRPVVRLAQMADELSRGNFDVEDVEVSTPDEIGVTARAFNKMKGSLKNYINEVQEKAQIEKNLAEQRVKNLEMQHLLRNAEVASLRSQMNPHFLFNSLNAGVQLAILEEAERTADFMNNLASLFRHNVRRLWRVNTISDEIMGLDYYARLLAVRFGDTYAVKKDISPELVNLQFPPLIFQPLVENAIIHGLEHREGGGTIWVRGERGEGHIRFSVEDDGCGIPEELAGQVLKPVSFSDEDFSNQSGMGLRNVVLRLRLFFEKEGIVSIGKSGKGGAAVEIVLDESEVRYV